MQLPSALRTLRGMIDDDKDEAAEQVAAALWQLEEAFAECRQGRATSRGGSSIGSIWVYRYTPKFFLKKKPNI